ncbi:UDP-glucose/GDP-mannose dehydrogenase family protein [Candidatus Woesearchaeota archaeon]|jgi:UDPglucose 6-dehydrogenase|nr:UDP-glucose/GDP-mannose dehydrogenase family protein [Candidatus Woesearchaeota archaeon]MBT5273087.1 UDP-glucose/GDP-mannose dehydrogenase family protein [Candidatus Woesearchaeota archaeon]MBT6040851.1 UDP-glucose/GDP-mannose dehydrogenase family protein [Candidatus Woesearchaeota archaeon]MBT6337598.1 UDP-glucose/GDP-mannose dehydrogenase family protein [Candidatus Woesearchaeota archaeon]MBT7927001.1 UDP-glucose/GDP-mannose dehydrogenase family protein [Candidatus Woesearchaeota archaeon
MRITMVGTGYVGLTTGACLANLGNDVICLDIDEKKIATLNNGKMPIYEPGLKELVLRNVEEGRLRFTTETKYAIESSDIIFIAVGTPEGEDGSADLKYVLAVAESIGKFANGYKLVVNKSTVPVGTAEKVRETIKLHVQQEFDVCSNPEFLREGNAIRDFLNPDRVVVGVDNGKATEMMIKIYKGIERTGNPIMITDIKSAELIKYASNGMLATRISFMNQLASLCEKMGADIKQVAKGMGLDSRIGPRFLQAGVGYGGSCFPKDVKALMETLKNNNCDSSILDAVDNVNEKQKLYVIPQITSLLGDVNGKKIALWGLAFKPKTDDMREAPSIVITKELQKLGAKIIAFDPIAQEESKKHLTNLEYGKTPYETVEGADCLVVVTEWDEFRHLDFKKVKSLMAQPNIIDGRNVYEPKEMRELGFNYLSIGRK